MPATTLSAPLPSGASPTSATQSVCNELRRQLIHSELAPGVKLKVESLKKTLNVGASPIREALSLLTSDQLVERIDQRGFRAAPVSEANLNEILTLRCQFDRIALHNSISNSEKEWHEHLVLMRHRLANINDQREISDAEQQPGHLHRQFHMALLSGCGSPMLLKFCTQLYDLNARYHFVSAPDQNQTDVNPPPTLDARHTDILNDVLNRRADAASEKLIQHYQQMGKITAREFSRNYHAELS